MVDNELLVKLTCSQGAPFVRDLLSFAQRKRASGGSKAQANPGHKPILPMLRAMEDGDSPLDGDTLGVGDGLVAEAVVPLADELVHLRDQILPNPAV